jgi:glycosyltransferase involved in cell wall biosynthesis
LKVLVKLPLSPYTGYGNDGIGICRALTQMGADVYIEPSTVQAPLPPDVALLLTKPVQGPFDLAIVHLDPKNLEASDGLKSVASVVIGWTMWEFTNFGNLEGRSKLRKQWKNFDAMVAYDQISADCIREYYRGPVIVQQGGFWPEDWPEVERDWDEQEFYFCMVGMLTERKDPFVAIQAFSELKHEHEDFDKHARLSLKTMVPGLHSKMEDVYPGLRVFYDVWDDETLKRFYAAQHVLLAPSRGEGKNMPALEFQSTGGVVIATNWGGHREWLSPIYSFGLNYELQPASPKYPNTLNARASVEHLKELMLHAFHNRSEMRDKGRIAASIIPTMSSWPAVFDKLFLKLKPIQGGERLWTLYSILEAPDASS